jgi:hypothetical protein
MVDRLPESNGKPEAKTQQGEYALETQHVEDRSTRGFDMSTVPPAAPAALRVQQLRLLQWPRGRRPTG